ncbi:MAG: cyclic nucleotide-binding domain-containing protein [Planctomycetaceae bacterium]
MLQQLTGDFISGLPPESLAKLEEIAREEHFVPGSQLFAEGGEHPDLHIILQGHVRLEMAIPRRGRQPLLSLGTGDVLAWSALLSGGRMTASAIALDSVRTASISGVVLRGLCEADPQLGYQMMKQLATALSRRLIATRLQLLDLFQEHEPVG